jgi:pimeloyl-ACP methyl ester carboxylesterase
MQDRSQAGLSRWQVAAAIAAGGAGAVALAGWLGARLSGPADSMIEAEERRFAWRRGEVTYAVTYQVKGRGAPVVLIHGIYVGASSFEYRRIFDLLARDFRVYAVDLLGFGQSQRPPVMYAPTLYEALILDFLTQVVGAADHPAFVVASTLSAAFTIRAAAERPSLFSRLVLIEPTGIESRVGPAAPPMQRALLAVLRSPLIGQAIYQALTSRVGLRYYLRRVHSDPRAVTSKLVKTYYAQTHKPGARYPIASFISGALDTPVRDLYGLLRAPILLVWGQHARFTPLEQARAFRQANARAETRVYDCGDLPQEEKAAEFARDVIAWLLAPIRSRR